MSFILDALKKAEAERQRQTGPTLLEVRVAQPRRRFPLWTLVIGALLAINILLLVVFALRRPAAGTVPPNMPAAVAPAPSPAPAPAPLAPVAAPTAPVAAAPLPAASAPILTPAPPPALAAALTAAAEPASAAASSDNPADFEPALPANRAGADTSANHYEPPSLSEIGGDMPDLRLDLHVYAARPADRYALINMHKVHEGDVLPEGPRVTAIDRDGVELSYRGTQFMLHPQ